MDDQLFADHWLFVLDILVSLGKTFIHIIALLTAIIGLGVGANLSSTDMNGYIGFTMFGTFRIWLVYCMSYYCILLCKNGASAVEWGREWLLTILELLIHAMALYYVFTSADYSIQCVLMGLFMFSTAIAMSGHSYIAKALEKSKLADFWGEVSISMYLIHSTVIGLFQNSFGLGFFGAIELAGLGLVIWGEAVFHYCEIRWMVIGIGAIKKLVQKVVTTVKSRTCRVFEMTASKNPAFLRSHINGMVWL